LSDEVSYAPFKVLQFDVDLMEGEDMETEDFIKMGQEWVWNNGCCMRVVIGRRLDQPSSYL